MTIRRLPPLNAIKAFEAAARHGSFTRAAVELSVTHGAVSRQIRSLEEWLGVKLFLRTSRNAIPTEAGAALLNETGRRSIAWRLRPNGCGRGFFNSRCVWRLCLPLRCVGSFRVSRRSSAITPTSRCG